MEQELVSPQRKRLRDPAFFATNPGVRRDYLTKEGQRVPGSSICQVPILGFWVFCWLYHIVIRNQVK